MIPLLTLLAFSAQATEITIEATDGQTAVVLIDDFVKGETPVVTDVDGGEVTLGFRSSMFGPVLFSKTITVPADGQAKWIVDVAGRTIEAVAGGSSAPAPAPAPEPAAPSVTQIKIDVKGAITVDGKPTGENGPATLEVDPGRHEIAIADGCAAGSTTFNATAGKTTTVSVPMAATKFMLDVKTEPAGAEVLVDGTSMGTTPLQAKLSCGTRLVKATKEGHFAAEKSIDLQKADTLTLVLEKEAFGSVEVSVTPSNATIKLDGEKVGVGTAKLAEVRTGPHELTVERKGTVLETRTINVKENGEMVLSLAVTEPAGKAPKADKPPKTNGTDGPKEKLARRSAGRMVLNTLVTGAAIPLVPIGLFNYQQARIAYDDYTSMPEGGARDQFYKTEVAPRQTVAFLEWGGAGALLATGTVLWVTSFADAPIVVVPTRTGVQLGGRF